MVRVYCFPFTADINRVKRSLFTRSYSTSETVSLREGVTSAASSPDSKARKRTRSDENDLFSTPKRRSEKDIRFLATENKDVELLSGVLACSFAGACLWTLIHPPLCVVYSTTHEAPLLQDHLSTEASPLTSPHPHGVFLHTQSTSATGPRLYRDCPSTSP